MHNYSRNLNDKDQVLPKFSRLCVVTLDPITYSETFLIDQINSLKAKSFVFSDILKDKTRLKSFLLIPDRLLRRFFKCTLSNWIKSFYFKQFLIKNSINLVFAEYGPTGASVARVCDELDIPLIVHFHGFDAFRDDIIQDKNNGYSIMFRVSTKIVVVSKPMEDALVKIGAPSHKIVYCPYGVDLALFKPTLPDKNLPIFLAVGRFVEKKSPDSTLLAFSRVHKKFPESRLVMVGEGPMLGACKKIVTDFGLQEVVMFKNICTHDEVNMLMKNARCFVQHSKVALNGDSEGTPVSILEASACALPVVSTKHAGIPSVIIDGVTGFLVDEEDINGMADAMAKFIEQPSLALEMGIAGRLHVEKNFSSEIRNNKIEKIIIESLNPKQSMDPLILPGIKKTFVLSVCGDSDVEEVNLCLKFLKKHISSEYCSSKEFDIVILAGRVTQVIDHDRVIKIDIPSNFSDSQGSRFLKTGIHRHLGSLEGLYCYVDNDAYLLSSEALSVFNFKKNIVSFATDHHATVKNFSASCLHYGNLKDAIFEHFGVSVASNWSIWNSGVYLFDKNSIPFLDTWHEYTLKTFVIPQWKVKDQGPLIAAVWKHGLQDIERIPSMYNWIYGLSEDKGVKTIYNYNGIEYQGNDVKVFHFIGKNKSKKDKLWVDAFSLIMDKNSKEFKQIKKIRGNLCR